MWFVLITLHLIENVRKTLTVSLGGETPEVQTYGENTQMKITTGYLINDPI